MHIHANTELGKRQERGHSNICTLWIVSRHKFSLFVLANACQSDHSKRDWWAAIMGLVKQKDLVLVLSLNVCSFILLWKLKMQFISEKKESSGVY